MDKITELLESEGFAPSVEENEEVSMYDVVIEVVLKLGIAVGLDEFREEDKNVYNEVARDNVKITVTSRVDVIVGLGDDEIEALMAEVVLVHVSVGTCSVREVDVSVHSVAGIDTTARPLKSACLTVKLTEVAYIQEPLSVS